MQRIAIAIGLIGLVALGPLRASANPVIDTTRPTAAQIERIQAELAGHKIYSELKPADHAQVVNALSRIQEKLGSDGVLSGLHPAAQADVVNDQELVNTLLAKARADSRLVCRREMPTGSNRPQTICMTVAERAAARERSKDVMRKTGISRPEIIP
ncbi:hypothetical protein SQW19_15925 [Stenotrophomonas acidaminiphila]|uniref:hypothetical protein n=1 Tax=Stenotrophomonas acidaminiphila TaxID=128780 RepID=UPI000CDC73EA|nr:hypothetical protein [Stenotrophomonas acidaminiphila]AUZ56192.1 hypothetical protein B1L07_15090 [Stenotrophomonas acidaminiphila]MPS33971.1 hypothetical protein [Stenotrophomonas sp.]WPU55800.1 hypothetical protein SQW19_15925 [Stenotrophomonas acidaminiphila]